MLARFFRQDSDGNFGPEGVCRSVSRRLLGHGFEAIPAPCGSSLFCFGCTALWVTVSRQILFAKHSEKFSRSLRKCRASALGSRAHSLGFALCDPSRIGKFNKTETKSCTRTK